MLYLANPTSPRARDLMAAGLLGFIDTPAQGNLRPAGVTWCADNGCFSDAFNEVKWWAFLERNASDAQTCLFATAPDVVGNAAATLARSLPWLPKIRALGYPAAFVFQDGQEALRVPWDEFDVAFIGGTTEWKLGPAAAVLISEAKTRGKWVHVGRVNSRRRFLRFDLLDVDSCDGTVLVKDPPRADKVARWGQTLPFGAA